MKKLLAILTLVFVTACSVELPKPAGKFVDVDDLQIHYTRAGSGERNVVLVHGFGSGSFTWEGIQERVPEGYTAWALDLPGFGFSEKPENLDYGLPRFAETVTSFIRQEIGRPVVLAGNSMGGATTIWAAANYPEWIAGAVPIDAAGAKLPDEGMPPVFHILRVPVLGPALFNVPQRFATAMTIRQIYGHKDRVSEELIDYYYGLSRLPGAANSWRLSLLDLVDKTEGGAVLDEMPKIKQDVLLMLGGKDPWISRDAMRQFQEKMPQAELKVYEDLGHVPMEEDPARVAPDLYGFADGIFAKARKLGDETAALAAAKNP
ncbi:MAG: alpha/beta hydrolase [Chrysiogenetes bacterium]|nr:alpha/beta hydrolase [Chrysiogenetes bacterium]